MNKTMLFALAMSACANEMSSESFGYAGSPALGLSTEALAQTYCAQGNDEQVANGQKAYIKDQLGSGWTLNGAWDAADWYGSGPAGRTVNVKRVVPPYDHYTTRTVIPSQGASWQTQCHCSGVPPAGGTVSCKRYK